ncbi:MAG: bifunctional oligoribonuclease/PAP phosphatase NrnA, partial [candidate division NC10 bacterium]|nr:bifunctional oligoribonuclease/PAP phosphatase NrnA [candidate division NC10 bacterium]
MSQLGEISRGLREARRIAILSHENPEGDAIGSSLGAYHALITLGKEVGIFIPDPVPSSLTFLPGSEKIQSTIPQDPP